MRHVERVYLALIAALAAAAGLVFVAITVGITANVVLRAVWSSGIPGLLDGIEYGLLGATMLAAPWVLSRNAHVSVDLLVGNLPGRLRRPLLVVTNLLGAALSAVFVWYSLDAALASAARGSMVRKTLVFPEWWALSVMPIAMALMAIEFLRRAAGAGQGDRSRVGL